jgi:hypothetical protein
MAQPTKAFPDNVPGSFFVDRDCAEMRRELERALHRRRAA